MKKKNSGIHENKSLKTFFIYTIIVFLIVIVALSVRLFFIFGQSKFDGHSIDVAINYNGQVVSIMGIDLEKKSISIIEINKKGVSVDNLAAVIGIIPEANIDAESNISNQPADSILTKILLKADGTKSDLTIIDKLRLLFFAKTAANIHQQRADLDPAGATAYIDKLIIKFFTDTSIVSENNSIQIINATDISGLGQGLERVIVNKGGNVISVTSSRDKKRKSIIRYDGDYNYTVRKLERILKIPSEKTESKSIGEIVIIIGKDYLSSQEKNKLLQ